MKWILRFILTSALFSSSAFADDKLIFAIDIIRHGDRTPTENLPAVTYTWKEGLGQLTATGMHQEFQLGAQQRKVYVEQYHLLPANYQPGSLYVRSSDFDRTLMSAESYLSGLYPQGTGPTLPDSNEPSITNRYQPIPIHTIPQSNETLLIPDSESYHFKDLIQRYVYPTTEWKEKSAEVAPKFAAWSKAIGITITDLNQLKVIGDVLHIGQRYHVPTPVGLSDDDVKEIIDAGEFAFVTELKNPDISKITGHELLKTIDDYLEKAAQEPSSLKYVLFSAHDSTILTQLSALGTTPTQPPPYASDLSFQLFQNAEKNYYVKVIYNSQPLTIPSCQKEICTLAQFSALVK